jgi:hypothetical protein
VVLLGSCFSDEIGSILQRAKFDAVVNPMGTIFNPASLAKCIRQALAAPTSGHELVAVETDGHELFFSYDYHSSFGARTSPERARGDVLAGLRALEHDLQQADFLLLTLGTAWVHRLRSSGEIVSNCHKMPASLFRKELLGVGAVVGELQGALEQLRELNPRLHTILTISPVRHW